MYDLTIVYEGVKGHSVREPPPNMFGENMNHSKSSLCTLKLFICENFFALWNFAVQRCFLVLCIHSCVCILNTGFNHCFAHFMS